MHEATASTELVFERVPSTDGVEVALHDLGGSGRSLLFAHATGLHGRCWEPVAHRLTGFRCWAIDFRGHGRCTQPPGLTYEWQGFADDVLSVVDALGLEHPVAAGHSKGGAALLLAEQRRPGTFAALWCFDPVAFPPMFQRGPGNPLSAAAERRRETFSSRDEAIANFRAKPPFDVVDSEALAAYVDHGFSVEPDGSLRLRCAPAVEAQVYRMGGEHDAFANLSRVHCSVTITRSRIEPGPAMVAADIAAALPRGRLVDLPHLTHFGPLEAPAEIATEISTALSTGAIDVTS